MVRHGGGNAAVAENMTGFTEKAATEGFIVVYPEGTSRFKDKLLTWRLSLLIIKVRSLVACTKTVSVWTSPARVADKGD